MAIYYIRNDYHTLRQGGGSAHLSTPIYPCITYLLTPPIYPSLQHDENVVIVQWHELVSGLRYDKAARNAHFTGILLGQLLHFIKVEGKEFIDSMQ